MSIDTLIREAIEHPAAREAWDTTPALRQTWTDFAQGEINRHRRPHYNTLAASIAELIEEEIETGISPLSEF